MIDWLLQIRDEDKKEQEKMNIKKVVSLYIYPAVPTLPTQYLEYEAPRHMRLRCIHMALRILWRHIYLLNSACAAVRDNKATNMPTHKSLLPGQHRLFHFPSIADNDLAVDLARVCSFPFLKRATANGQIKGEQCGPANGVSEREGIIALE